MTDEQKLALCIRAALMSVGIAAGPVAVAAFSREHFGNHLADVETPEGAIRVIFDRQYEVDLLDSRIAPERVPDMVRALTHEFRAAVAAGL